MSEENDMNPNQETMNPPAAADLPQPEPAVTPESVLDQLRAVRMGEVMPLTPAQRKTLRNHTRTPYPVLQASINVIGALDIVAHAVGQPAEDVRQMDDEANRWTAVEDELRKMLSGVVGANLIRRQRVALRARQAFMIGTQLARDPAHAILVPHLQEIKRLRGVKRRKKPAPAAPQSPGADTTDPVSGNPES
jgi:hypothetical protein